MRVKRRVFLPIADLMIRGTLLRRRLLWAAAGTVWLVAVVVGLALVASYDHRPGAQSNSPDAWPDETPLVRSHEQPTLVMFAHPRCDCTRASLAEFAEVMARAAVRPKAYVVFIRPGRVESRWEMTELWRAAEAIPGVRVVRDDDGEESKRFRVQTSGQTLLYDASGRLVFSGGTTASRGKAGDSLGRASLLALLEAEAPPASSASVFGCPLHATEVPNPLRELLPQ